MAVKLALAIDTAPVPGVMVFLYVLNIGGETEDSMNGTLISSTVPDLRPDSLKNTGNPCRGITYVKRTYGCSSCTKNLSRVSDASSGP